MNYKIDAETDYLNLFSLKDKVAIVTGGAGIIGAEICRAFCQAGAKVIIADTNEQKAKELADNYSKHYGVSCVGFFVDICDKKIVEDFTAQIVADFNHIDILINNAASKGNNPDHFFEPYETFSLETWRQIQSVNVEGMFLMSQAIGKIMVDKKICGSIVQTSSIYGVLGPDQRIYSGSEYNGREINSPAVYSATKAAVVGLTKYLATYWGKYGLRVNTICPGGVQSGQNDEFVQKYSQRVPLNRMAEASEIASAVLFLASDASRYINGHTLMVDGGLSAW
jgi:NAD(P)-dependent dehydrogenase (short-subunit alcohol dehydrogenase family)